MSNASEKVCQTCDDVKSTAQAVRDEIGEVKRTVTVVADTAKVVHKIIAGNGRPEEGLLFRVTMIERQLAWSKWLLIALAALLGGKTGVDVAPRLLEIVADGSPQTTPHPDAIVPPLYLDPPPATR